MPKKEQRQTNVSLFDEDIDKATEMAQEDGYDKRSPFVRWLIRQEWDRRHAVKLVLKKSEIK
jgi:metal-responsive CopG/Arc/MetJ family transcriptional regulator